MRALPAEAIYQILDELPRSDVGARTLARCSMTGDCLLREAAMDQTIWKDYYEGRYKHADISHEATKVHELGANWRLMYAARRRIDNAAVECLKGVEKATESDRRTSLARTVVALGFDVWDVLSEEAWRPLPPLLQTDGDIANISNGFSLTNLARKFWASELLRVIARRNAIDVWREVYADDHDPTVTFEDALATLSSFHGIHPEQVRTSL